MVDSMGTDFYETWWWLVEHPIFYSEVTFTSYFVHDLDIHVTKVNPETGEQEDDEELNTQLEFWLEHGPWQPADAHMVEQCSHDFNLDCGGLTFEAAIMALAAKVKEHYGDYDRQEQETYRHQQVKLYLKNNCADDFP